jgi:hypothetical protein
LGSGTATALHVGAQASRSVACDVLSPSELKLGEAYIYDDFNIEGDIEAAFDLADYLLGQGRCLRGRF